MRRGHGRIHGHCLGMPECGLGQRGLASTQIVTVLQEFGV